MIKDGKYKLRKDDQEYDAIVSTLTEGQYPCKSERQFVCISGHFPIPLDSWLLEDFVMIHDPAAQQSVQRIGGYGTARLESEVSQPANR